MGCFMYQYPKQILTIEQQVQSYVDAGMEITSYEDVEKYMGRKADRNRKIYNGMMKTYYYQFLGPKPPKRKMDDEKKEG